ncbi:EGF domain-containing protein [Ditylenchus destructor]|nr:EGF domain-containing protein [Ditylenchus destructor]
MQWGAFFSALGPLLFSQQSIRLYCLLGLFLIIQQIRPGSAETNATSSREASQSSSIVNNAHNFGASHLAAASSASAKAQSRAKSHRHRSKSNLISDEDSSSTSAESIERNESIENSSSTIGSGKKIIHQVRQQNIISGGYVLLRKNIHSGRAVNVGIDGDESESYTEPQTCDSGCPENSDCVIGYCKCRIGFGWNGVAKKCEDINECETLEEPCKPHANSSSSSEEIWCVNTPGSYHCCPPGRRGFAECAGIQILAFPQTTASAEVQEPPCNPVQINLPPPERLLGPGRHGHWRTVTYGEWRNFSGGHVLLKRKGKVRLKSLTTVLSSEIVSKEGTEEAPDQSGDNIFGLEIIGAPKEVDGNEAEKGNFTPTNGKEEDSANGKLPVKTTDVPGITPNLPESGEGGDTINNEQEELLRRKGVTKMIPEMHETMLTSSAHKGPAVNEVTVQGPKSLNVSTTTEKYYEYKIEIVKNQNTTDSSTMITPLHHQTTEGASEKFSKPSTPALSQTFPPPDQIWTLNIPMENASPTPDASNTNIHAGNMQTGVVSADVKIGPSKIKEKGTVFGTPDSTSDKGKDISQLQGSQLPSDGSLEPGSAPGGSPNIKENEVGLEIGPDSPDSQPERPEVGLEIGKELPSDRIQTLSTEPSGKQSSSATTTEEPRVEITESGPGSHTGSSSGPPLIPDEFEGPDGINIEEWERIKEIMRKMLGVQTTTPESGTTTGFGLEIVAGRGMKGPESPDETSQTPSWEDVTEESNVASTTNAGNASSMVPQTTPEYIIKIPGNTTEGVPDKSTTEHGLEIGRKGETLSTESESTATSSVPEDSTQSALKTMAHTSNIGSTESTTQASTNDGTTPQELTTKSEGDKTTTSDPISSSRSATLSSGSSSELESTHQPPFTSSTETSETLKLTTSSPVLASTISGEETLTPDLSTLNPSTSESTRVTKEKEETKETPEKTTSHEEISDLTTGPKEATTIKSIVTTIENTATTEESNKSAKPKTTSTVIGERETTTVRVSSLAPDTTSSPELRFKPMEITPTKATLENEKVTTAEPTTSHVPPTMTSSEANTKDSGQRTAHTQTSSALTETPSPAIPEITTISQPSATGSTQIISESTFSPNTLEQSTSQLPNSRNSESTTKSDVTGTTQTTLSDKTTSSSEELSTQSSKPSIHAGTPVPSTETPQVETISESTSSSTSTGTTERTLTQTLTPSITKTSSTNTDKTKPSTQSSAAPELTSLSTQPQALSSELITQSGSSIETTSVATTPEKEPVSVSRESTTKSFSPSTQPIETRTSPNSEIPITEPAITTTSEPVTKASRQPGTQTTESATQSTTQSLTASHTAEKTTKSTITENTENRSTSQAPSSTQNYSPSENPELTGTKSTTKEVISSTLVESRKEASTTAAPEHIPESTTEDSLTTTTHSTAVSTSQTVELQTSTSEVKNTDSVSPTTHESSTPINKEVEISTNSLVQTTATHQPETEAPTHMSTNSNSPDSSSTHPMEPDSRTKVKVETTEAVPTTPISTKIPNPSTSKTTITETISSTTITEHQVNIESSTGGSLGSTEPTLSPGTPAPETTVIRNTATSNLPETTTLSAPKQVSQTTPAATMPPKNIIDSGETPEEIPNESRVGEESISSSSFIPLTTIAGHSSTHQKIESTESPIVNSSPLTSPEPTTLIRIETPQSTQSTMEVVKLATETPIQEPNSSSTSEISSISTPSAPEVQTSTTTAQSTQSTKEVVKLATGTPIQEPDSSSTSEISSIATPSGPDIQTSTTIKTPTKTTKDVFKLESTRPTTSTESPTPDLLPSPTPLNHLQCVSSDECGVDAYCERRSGACRCHPGFRGMPPQTPCVDVNECDHRIDDCHSTSRCHNYVGGYGCHCAAGYRRNQNGICEDINECQEQNGTLCHVNAVCVNLPGTYSCSCESGFVGDGYSCIRIEKRRCTPNEWVLSDCGRNHVCLVDAHGHIDCDSCKRGFRQKNGVCSDINECVEGKHNGQMNISVCHPDAVCTNSMGSYSCRCRPGYTGDGFQCRDVDECNTSSNGYSTAGVQRSPCHPQAECINLLGSYTCKCPDGWAGNGYNQCINSAETKQCEDVDECDEGRHNCDLSLTSCINTVGGHICRCLPGYEGGDDGICTDIDECQRNIAGCHQNANCINKIAGFQCQCAVGFTGNGRDCVAIGEGERKPANGCQQEWTDMCKTQNKTCHIDDEEMPQCGSCIFGYQPMNGKCQPISELGNCAEPSKNNCNENAECIDINPGNHFCACKVGFIGDGLRCDDVDECSIPGLCDPNAICINLKGTFECICKADYKGDGFKCKPEDNATLSGGGHTDCRKSARVCHPNAQCLSSGLCKCIDGFEGDGVLCRKAVVTELPDLLSTPKWPSVTPLGNRITTKPVEITSSPSSTSVLPKSTTKDVFTVWTPPTQASSFSPFAPPSTTSKSPTDLLPSKPSSISSVHSSTVTFHPVTEQKSSSSIAVTTTQLPLSQMSSISTTVLPSIVTLPIHKSSTSQIIFEKTFPTTIVAPSSISIHKSSTSTMIPEPISTSSPKSLLSSSVPSYVTAPPRTIFTGSHAIEQRLSTTAKPSTENGWSSRSTRIPSRIIYPPATTIRPNNATTQRPFTLTQKLILSTQTKVPLFTSSQGTSLPPTEGTVLPLCSPSDKSACHILAICEPSSGTCRCLSGYEGDGYTTCVQTWEDCTTNSSICHRDARCDPITKECRCRSGFLGDGTTCVPDRLDCGNRGRTLCSANADCIGRRCRCREGYTGDGITCMSLHPPTAVDDCLACHCKATCEHGQCQCGPGYFGNGLLCVPDPEDCVNYKGLCSPLYAQCNESRRRCECKKGFTGDGLVCSPSSSCLHQPGICHRDAYCLPSGWCKCKTDYNGDGYNCAGMPTSELRGPNGCLTKCGPNADCVNGACRCLPGYVGNQNGICVDIDECTTGVASCGPHGVCRNTEGDYDCDCLDGYINEGKECFEYKQIGELGVQCLPNGIRIVIPRRNYPYGGKIFVRGEAENPYCSKTLGTNEEYNYFQVSNVHCNVQNEPNNTVAVTVIVQEHQMFVTSKANAYRLRCTYPSPTLYAHINVSELTTTQSIVKKAVAPSCHLAVTNENDRTIASSTVGDVLKLSLSIQPNETYAILPRNCFVINLEGGERQAITDAAGCAVDPVLFPEWTRVKPYLSEALFRTFKWSDTSMIRFECDCSACFGSCPKINCGPQPDANVYRRMRFRFVRKSDMQSPDDMEFSKLAQEEKEAKEHDEFEENAWLADVINNTVTTLSAVLIVKDNTNNDLENNQQHRLEWWISNEMGEKSALVEKVAVINANSGRYIIILAVIASIIISGAVVSVAILLLRRRRRTKMARKANPFRKDSTYDNPTSIQENRSSYLNF